MGFISAIKKKWNDWYYHDLDDGDFEEAWEEEPVTYSDRYFRDPDQRATYVLEALGRMAEAAEKMEDCEAEYKAVTSLLVDMEELENLPSDARKKIKDLAKRIESLEIERRQVFSESGRLSDETVDTMQRLEGEIPEGLRKIKEAEKYRKLIKMDLRKLDNERDGVKYRRRELKNTIANSKGISFICLTAVFVCIALLLVLKFLYEMEVSIGFLIAGGLGAITLTVLYVRYMDAVKELKVVEKTSNKLVTLHNTVKIRYVNNTNLLSYMYMKFGVESSEELEDTYQTYLEETSARARDERLKNDLEYSYKDLTRTLSRYGAKDPDIWIHQTKALYDKKEAVEVRHALIGRRQKLREQMEYNQKIAKDEQSKILELGKRHPEYSKEIANMVSKYNGI